MFQEYAKISEKDIEDIIKSEMSGDIKKGMLTIGETFLSFPCFYKLPLPIVILLET